jgi:hypothetical protein
MVALFFASAQSFKKNFQRIGSAKLTFFSRGLLYILRLLIGAQPPAVEPKGAH